MPNSGLESLMAFTHAFSSSNSGTCSKRTLAAVSALRGRNGAGRLRHHNFRARAFPTA
jgi:hypothetical protein